MSEFRSFWPRNADIADILSIFQLHFTEFNSRLQDVPLCLFFWLIFFCFAQPNNFRIVDTLGFHLLFLALGNWHGWAKLFELSYLYKLEKLFLVGQARWTELSPQMGRLPSAES